jgi:hypothetical protein
MTQCQPRYHGRSSIGVLNDLAPSKKAKTFEFEIEISKARETERLKSTGREARWKYLSLNCKLVSH